MSFVIANLMPVIQKETPLKVRSKSKGQEDRKIFSTESLENSPDISSAEDEDPENSTEIDLVDVDNTLKSFDVLSFNNSMYKTPGFYNSYLRPNSKFVGIQQSGKAKYNIRAEFKTVDLVNSLVVGFLQINGLTEQYPEMTTCFKGEIINNPFKVTNELALNKEYSFITENKKWESSFTNDLDHWKKLTNYYNLTDADFLNKLKLINDDKKDQGLLYMRWKEEFLLPDSRIKEIKGASFEGFYYIVLNVGNLSKSNLPIGTINGLYYHRSSEKFQSLTLTNIDEGGKSESFQFL